jgi:hypothetical protein
MDTADELATQAEQGDRCKKMWCAVVLSSLDEWIGYPNDTDRLGRIATHHGFRDKSNSDWKTKRNDQMKEIARKEGIQDAYEWLESADAIDTLMFAGMSTSNRARSKLLEYVIAGVPTAVALSGKVHDESIIA